MVQACVKVSVMTYKQRNYKHFLSQTLEAIKLIGGSCFSIAAKMMLPLNLPSSVFL